VDDLEPVQGNYNNASLLPNRPGSVAVTGALDGFRPGPQIGQEVESRRRVLLAAFAEEGVRR
jgi:hypothetical protein